MSDIEITNDARMAVAAAFSFAGQPGNSEAAWRVRFNEGVLRAAAQMNGRAAKMAQEVLDADVFRAEYLGHELEESSTRLLVHVRSDTTAKSDANDDGTETLRTERTDNALGRAMQKRLEAIQPGTTILVFKYIEHMEGRGSKNKVRIMKHFEFLAPPSGDATPSPSSQRTPSQPPTPAPPPGDDRPSPGGTDLPPIAEAMNRMSNAQRVQVARRARQAGIENFIQPGDREAEVLHIIEEVLGE